MIEATGLPLGLFDDANYDEFRFKMKPGDMFVFFSDGILDARNRAGDLFGRDRLSEIASKQCGTSAEEVVKAIFAAVDDHAAGMETFDDQTVVVMQVKNAAGKRK